MSLHPTLHTTPGGSLARGPESPRARAYLEQLPHGLDSYPDVRAKASLVHELLPLTVGWPLDRSLPEPILDLWRSPPPVTRWVPEVSYRALKLAMLDAQGLSDDEALERMRSNYRRLIRGPLYGALFSLLGAERMIRGAPSRWTQFHRGTSLDIEAIGPRSATVELRTPHPILFGLVGELQVLSFRVILERAHADGVRFDTEPTDRGFRYSIAW